jgi:DNA-binding MurR/RpiR family transcriptional regulator
VVAFAFPRYPIAILNLLKVAAARGIPRLGFTDSTASPLSRLADPCVFLPFELLAVVDSLAAPISFLSGVMAEVVKRQPRRTAAGLQEFESFAEKFSLLYRERV